MKRCEEVDDELDRVRIHAHLVLFWVRGPQPLMKTSPETAHTKRVPVLDLLEQKKEC